MGFLDDILGRTKPVKSQLDQLFAISTAYVTLTVDQSLKASDRAGITFRPVSNADFARAGQELTDLLKISGQETQTKVEQMTDKFKYQWVLLQDEDFEDLVSTAYMISITLQEQGFRDQLLAAVFKFYQKDQPIYWIYNYKRGSFYPFAPTSGTQERDNALELQMRSVMSRELPIEPELERWYPMWDLPF